MAFHPKKQGGDSFSKKVARKDTKSFICSEPISKGSERYVSRYNNSLCNDCYKAWMAEGGRLGHISRAIQQ